jgi:uncharacterized protein (TIGR02001 family)
VSRPRRLPRLAALILLAALAAAPARAQLSGSATLVSDDRFRGLSRSDGQPGLSLALAFDADAGWYAGGSLARAELWPDHRRPQWQAYAGRSRRLSATLAWEGGLSGVHFAGGGGYDYGELYAGLLGERLQGRLYLSPDYFGRDARSAYAEVDGRWPLGRGLHALAHAGLLAVSRNPADGRRQRADVLLGGALVQGGVQVQLAWSGAQRGGPYPATAYGGRRSGWSLSLSLYF